MPSPNRAGAVLFRPGPGVDPWALRLAAYSMTGSFWVLFKEGSSKERSVEFRPKDQKTSFSEENFRRRLEEIRGLLQKNPSPNWPREFETVEGAGSFPERLTSEQQSELAALLREMEADPEKEDPDGIRTPWSELRRED